MHLQFHAAQPAERIVGSASHVQRRRVHSPPAFFSLLLFLLQLHVFPCRRPCLWTGHASLPGVSISAGLRAHPSSALDASAASDARRFPDDQSTEPTPAFPAFPLPPLPSHNPFNPFCELPLQCKVTDAFPHAMKKKKKGKSTKPVLNGRACCTCSNL